MSQEEDKRQFFFDENKDRLAQLAYRATKLGVRLADFLVVCIEVDDPAWTGLVDHFMPNYDWQSIRNRGEKPIARGTVSNDLTELLANVLPSIKSSLTGPLPAGRARAVVLADGGAAVYFIVPEPEANRPAIFN